MSDTKDLSFYKAALSSLRMAKQAGRSKPYKVCLLLSVFDAIADGAIKENKIYLDDDLKQRYTNWLKILGDTIQDTNTPEQPFFYLESASFWYHKPNEDCMSEYKERLAERNHRSAKIVGRIIDYAYLDTELFEYIKSPITRLELIPSLRQSLNDKTTMFENWALSVGKSPKTVKNYVGALNGRLYEIAEKSGLYKQQLCAIDDVDTFNKLDINLRQKEEFVELNNRGNYMYSSALKLYGEFLADNDDQDVQEDIQTITLSPQLDVTEKNILTKARLGQGIYRKNLISYWGGCAVTGIKNQRLLIASHIKPWSKSSNEERLDTFNGLLLSPNLDKVFDLGYISFDAKGKILISQELERPVVLGITSEMQIPLAAQHHSYLAHHRDSIFKAA